jgi:subtilisin family serine protease
MSVGSWKVRRRAVGLIAVVAALAVALPGTAARRPQATAKASPAAGNYIVQLTAQPVASYRGGKPGLAATSPKRTGRRLSKRSSAVRAYRSYLAGQQRAALARLGTAQPRVTYSYRTTFAGFAARLTAKQVTALRRAPEVLRVTRDELRHITSVASDNAALDDATFPDSAAYLNLPEGLWQRLGGSENAGDGVIVGDLDTGIQPGHPSFADDADGYVGPAYSAPPDTWAGTCQTGPGFTAADCNNKLIGARFFVDGFGVENLAPGDALSPRDDDGHGSHTASTAAGNFGVDPSIDGNGLGVNRISGIAPRARISAYKVCWTGAVADGCALQDILAGIEAATDDGVDVINYSVGSDTSTPIGPDSFAFLGATDAGVFVASSAGNAGPDASTVGDPASVPWVISVAAATNSRTFESTATISDGPGSDFDVTGASASTALSTPTALVDAADAAADGVDPAKAELCDEDSLDPADVGGAVVLCKRGLEAGRIAASKNVQAAGGVGMILYNATEPNDLGAYPYWLPTVAVDHADGLAIKQAIDDPASEAKATISAGTAAATDGAVLAAFSSRGPQGAVANIAKPDVAAPGVNILAAAADQTPPGGDIKPGRLFQVISGTSMSSPHVAGAAALLTQLHPTFSSAALKSSLMTTANPDVKREDGTTPADPFDTGSGQIDPNAAADPGLVLETGTNDYFEYLEEVDPADFPGDGATIKPADLNVASISNATLAGSASTRRTFTSVDSVTRRWTVAAQGLEGITTTPSVDAFTIKPGQTQEVGLDFLVTSAPVDHYRFGALVLTSGDRTVRLPISLQPTKVAVPTPVTVSTDQVAGTQGIPVKAGYTGQLSALGHGLAPAQIKAGETIERSPSGGPDPGGVDPGTRMYTYDVPASAQLFLTRLENVDGGDPSTDLDLYVYRDANGDGKFTVDEIVALSASGTSKEHVELSDPAAGHYGVEVVGFGTQTPVSTYDLVSGVVADATPDQADAGPSITVGGDPKDVTPGATPSLDLAWSNVTGKGRYFGVVTYHDSGSPTAGNAIATSIVELEQTADHTPPPPGGGGGGAGGTTPPTNPPTGSKPKLKLTLSSARLKGRTLTLRLRASHRARIRTTASRLKHKVASAKVRTVTTRTRVLRVKLNRRLKKGRTYTIRIAAYSGKRLAASDSVKLKVRKTQR